MMKIYRFLLMLALCFVFMSICAQDVEKGVSEELARQRKASISNISYNLTFNIPAEPKDEVTGKAIVTFNLKYKEDVVLDFQGNLLDNVTVGKKKRRKISAQDGHIIIPKKYLKSGLITLTIEFSAQSNAMERHADYILTHFATADASSTFP